MPVFQNLFTKSKKSLFNPQNKFIAGLPLFDKVGGQVEIQPALRIGGQVEIQPALRIGGKLRGDAFFQPQINPTQPSGNFLIDIAKVLLPLAGSALGAFLVKKGSEKVEELFNKKNTVTKANNIINDIGVNDKDIKEMISSKSKAILDNIITGSGISLI